MAARDKFTAELKCRSCGKAGEARLSELDGWSFAKGDKSTSVDYLPPGFKVVAQPSWYGTVDLFCADCDISALTK